jgi:hypothetical protein
MVLNLTSYLAYERYYAHDNFPDVYHLSLLMLLI